MNRATRVLIVLIWAFAAACTKPKTVAEVGSYLITNQDVGQRDAVIKVLNPQIQKTMGMEQLIRSYTLLEILKARGRVITDEDFEKEEKRLSMFKGPNNKFDSVREVFGNDLAALRRVYIVPLLAERLAYQELFAKDEKALAPAKKTADAFLAEAMKSPERLQELAKAKGLATKKGTYSAETGLDWEDERGPASFAVPRGKPMAVIWEKEVLKGLLPGKVQNRLIDFGNHWLVLKSTGRKAKGGMDLFVVALPRPTFGTWFEEAKKGVEVKRLTNG